MGRKDEAAKDELKRKFKQASTVASLQDMIRKLSIQCFHKCVSPPTDSLQGYEKKCITMCMDRYVDSYNLVARAYGTRLQQELRKGLGQQRTAE